MIRIFLKESVSYIVSKGIVDLHGGVIGMSSDGQGCGSVFFVELPLVSPRGHGNENIHVKKHPSQSLVSLTEDTIPALKASNEVRLILSKEEEIEETLVHPATVHLKMKRALVVDDAALNRKMISRLLALRHFDIHEASDGLEALCRLRACVGECLPPYDVILMDFVMPNMDGPTATREIRGLGYSGIIIGVTGNALAEDIELFMTCGANKVLPKPLQIEDLMNTLTGKNSEMPLYDYNYGYYLFIHSSVIMIITIIISFSFS